MKEQLEKLLLIFIVLFLLGYFFYESQVIKVIENVKEQQNEILNLNEKITKLNPYINNVDSLKDKILKNNKDLDGISKLIPKNEETSNIIKYFYELTREHNITGNKIFFERYSNKKDNFNTTLIHYSAVGDKGNIMSIINDIQNEPNRIMNIEEVSLTPNNNLLYLNMKIKIYYEKQESSNLEVQKEQVGE